MKEQFKAAGRLVNEWRDTLFYNGLAGVTVAYCAAAHDITAVPIYVGSLREIARGIFWLESKDQKCLVGSSDNPIHKKHFHYSSLAGCAALWAIDGFINQLNGVAVYYALMTIALTRWAGRSQNVRGAYKIMWDWPRKRDGGDGGIGQTTKIKKAFSNLARGTGKPLAPTYQVITKSRTRQSKKYHNL